MGVPTHVELDDVNVSGASAGAAADSANMLHTAPVRRGGLLKSTAVDVVAALVILTAVYNAGSTARGFVARDAMLFITMPRESSFAIAKPNASIYYADLGGTTCMCDNRWSVQEYWQKVFSSYAFNLAHLLGNTNLAIMTYSGSNSMFLVLMVFVNEFVEEMLVATTARWGFAADPPSDSEPRYDSLIRDVICSCLGVYVGISCSKAFGCKPVVRGPPLLNIEFSRKAGLRGIIGYRSDPHSLIRWLNWIVQWHAMNTIIIGTYNTDAGINKFNKANIVMIFIYPATIAAFCWYHLRQGTWAELPRRRIIAWHCAWAAVGCFIIGFVVYPVTGAQGHTQRHTRHCFLDCGLPLTLTRTFDPPPHTPWTDLEVCALPGHVRGSLRDRPPRLLRRLPAYAPAGPEDLGDAEHVLKPEDGPYRVARAPVN
jgi:hypothetical protein